MKENIKGFPYKKQAHIVADKEGGTKSFYRGRLEEGIIPMVLPSTFDLVRTFGLQTHGIKSSDRLHNISHFVGSLSYPIVTGLHGIEDYLDRNRNVLGEVYGAKSDVDLIISACVKKFVVEPDDKYCPKIKSLGYRLGENHRHGSWKQEYFNNPRMAQRILEQRNRQILESVRKTPCGEYMRGSLDSFGFNDSIEDYFINLATNPDFSEGQKFSRQYTYEHFWDCDLFKVSQNTGRLFTPVTILARDLRELLEVEGEPTGEVDLANSQPFLLASCFPPDTREIDHFHEVVCSGRFYETLNEALDEPYENRDELKRDCYRKIFFNRWANDKHPHPLCLAMRKLWPTVADYLDRKRKERGKTVASELQQRESSLFLGECVPQIEKEIGCPIATVHDSIVGPDSKVSAIRDLVEEIITEKTGLRPMLKIKGRVAA